MVDLLSHYTIRIRELEEQNRQLRVAIHNDQGRIERIQADIDSSVTVINNRNAEIALLRAAIADIEAQEAQRQAMQFVMGGA
jgi:septal ring factor EnvC (AmiA/AmiB activator)